MTLEQAKSLKPGDTIMVTNCGDISHRILTSSQLANNERVLLWTQEGALSKHSWEIEDIILVKSKESIINNYQIY